MSISMRHASCCGSELPSLRTAILVAHHVVSPIFVSVSLLTHWEFKARTKLLVWWRKHAGNSCSCDLQVSYFILQVPPAHNQNSSLALARFGFSFYGQQIWRHGRRWLNRFLARDEVTSVLIVSSDCLGTGMPPPQFSSSMAARFHDREVCESSLRMLLRWGYKKRCRYFQLIRLITVYRFRYCMQASMRKDSITDDTKSKEKSWMLLIVKLSSSSARQSRIKFALITFWKFAFGFVFFITRLELSAFFFFASCLFRFSGTKANIGRGEAARLKRTSLFGRVTYRR